MFLDSTHVGGQSLLILFHGGALDAEVTLPAQGEAATYRLVWDSTWALPPPSGGDQSTLTPTVDPDDGPLTLTASSVRVYALVP
jgi:hypothetical protein